MRGDGHFPPDSCCPPRFVSLAKVRMPHKPKVPRGCSPVIPGTWHQAPRSLGQLSLEPLLRHGAGTDENGLFRQPLRANKGQSPDPRGHAAVSPNRVQVPHQPAQVNSLLCPLSPSKAEPGGKQIRARQTLVQTLETA